MLQIKTIKNHLIAGKEKEAFCFRSVASQTLDENALIKEMLSYNSSFTEADISGLFSVLGTVVNKYLAKGYNVILPFGALREMLQELVKLSTHLFHKGQETIRSGLSLIRLKKLCQK